MSNPVTIKKAFILLECTCLLTGVLLVAKPLYRFGKRQISHARSESLWQQSKKQPTAMLQSGSPAMWLRIPQSNVDDLVLVGASKENLDRHPSLVHTMSSVILGHRDTHFRGLQHIRHGDIFTTETRDGSITTYRVTEIEIMSPFQASSRLKTYQDPNTCVLMTCYPFNYIGPAPDRFVVWAIREEST